MDRKQKNLRSFAEYSREELQEVSRRGGIASGISRQERKQLREELTALLSAGNVQERVCTALIERAANGDSRAFAIIRDTIGEGAAQKFDIGLHGKDDTLEDLRQDCMHEIMDLYYDEFRRETPLYGSLSFKLAGVRLASEVRRRHAREILAPVVEQL